MKSSNGIFSFIAIAIVLLVQLPTSSRATFIHVSNQPEQGYETAVDGSSNFTVLDVEHVSILNPAAAVKVLRLAGKPKIMTCDVLVAGGGMGGTAGAIRAAGAGARVCLTEETSWIGGQMTSQGVSALDENYLVETSGATRLYQRLRALIRDHYRARPGANAQACGDPLFNPGNCWVSRLAFEPTVALSAINQLIRECGVATNLRIATRQKIVKLKVKFGQIRSALAVDLDTGKFTEYRARYFIDATELGDLLPMAGVAYGSGAESKVETSEPHAPEIADKENVQDFTYPFVLEFDADGEHRMQRPAHYDEFKSQGKFGFYAYKMFGTVQAPARESETQAFYSPEYLPFWTYRRLVAAENFPDSIPGDLAMINWMSNDLRGENIIDKSAEMQARRLSLGKSLSLGFLYWLQNEAPRDEGGVGYAELKLRTDVLGTADGLSMFPYIREARRIKAKKIIVEQDIAAATNATSRARLCPDAVGIGLYPIDIHGRQDVPGAQQAALPFQIPLSAMVQNQVDNLIPAAKNIGTTHITNGAFRLHPVEWAIGEAAGTLVALCFQLHRSPVRVLGNRAKLAMLQQRLVALGAPVFWFDDIATAHPNFEAIQMLAVSGIMPIDQNSLSFRPDDPITADERSQALSKIKLWFPRAAIDPASIELEQTRAQFAGKLYDRLCKK